MQREIKNYHQYYVVFVKTTMFMKKLFYLCAILAFTLMSCNDNDVNFNNNAINESSTGLLIKKVRKLENPYSVSNMKKAYSALQQEGLMKAALNIEATHLYVRFLPKDSVESELLMRDTTLTLFSYPLDYELTEGEKYIDSTLIGNDFTWLYTRVPVGFISPISQYEVLDELYMPMIVDENGGANQQNISQLRIKSEVVDYWNLLEEKSLKLTGNYQEKQPTQSGMRKAKKYTPQATIRVYDDLLGINIPVSGIGVRARWWFNWESGITNSAGVAVMSGTFTGDYNWSIEWVSSLWSIRDGSLFTAYYNGPKGNQSNWVFNIDAGKSKAYGHVQRACYNMFYGNNLGAYKLPSTIVSSNGLGTIFPINISVYELNGRDKSGINYGGGWLFFSQLGIYMTGFEDITFKNKDGKDSVVQFDRYYESYNLFGTTTHELAHSTHIINMDLDIASFLFVKNIVVESWASAVEWSVTNNEYNRLGLWYSLDYNNRQNWALLKSDNSKNIKSMDYSPVFIDLMDTYNQRNYSYYDHVKYEYPDDNVSGFTLSELKGVLRKTFTIGDLKKNVKALRSDSTELANIDKLFETYEKAK